MYATFSLTCQDKDPEHLPHRRVLNLPHQEDTYCLQQLKLCPSSLVTTISILLI